MNIQPVTNIAEICAQHGIVNIVLSPGSRCAPLIIAFARHGAFQVRTVSDERAAAFIALGMALTTGKPTVLVCTSGTAALNYAPAVAEAYFQHVPLLLLTADRPPEWIDQMDGQTIRQQNVFGQHIKDSFSFPVDFSHPDAVWHSERLVSEAINISNNFPAGPVHINIPLREPFYPKRSESVSYSQSIKVITEYKTEALLTPQLSLKLQEEILRYRKVLVVAGQDLYDAQLLQSLYAFTESTGAILVGDILSNLQKLPNLVRHQDVFLACQDIDKLNALKPDLLITFGKSVISKSLKLYLRKNKPKSHWHVQPAGQVADTYQALTKVIRCNASSFFSSLTGSTKVDSTFTKSWVGMNLKSKRFLTDYLATSGYHELAIVSRIMKGLPQKSNLHLANSMSVRYANILALLPEQDIEVYANRGTSGIDGSTSTAVGCALTSEAITTLITGDLSFFYDRNGLWHNYRPANLRIIILNNHAGGIFRLIDGPKQQPELEPYFETEQLLNAENTARDFNFSYTSISSIEKLDQALPKFFSTESGPGILEIFTDSPSNAKAFELYRQAVRSIDFSE
jgi:2-succinyl-5-enolpyruvyl-6-hydroxy-3-cyclohexene-1-carboxylate synthase